MLQSNILEMKSKRTPTPGL